MVQILEYPLFQITLICIYILDECRNINIMWWLTYL